MHFVTSWLSETTCYPALVYLLHACLSKILYSSFSPLPHIVKRAMRNIINPHTNTNHARHPFLVVIITYLLCYVPFLAWIMFDPYSPFWSSGAAAIIKRTAISNADKQYTNDASRLEAPIKSTLKALNSLDFYINFAKDIRFRKAASLGKVRDQIEDALPKLAELDSELMALARDHTAQRLASLRRLASAETGSVSVWWNLRHVIKAASLGDLSRLHSLKSWEEACAFWHQQDLMTSRMLEILQLAQAELKTIVELYDKKTNFGGVKAMPGILYESITYPLEVTIRGLAQTVLPYTWVEFWIPSSPLTINEFYMHLSLVTADANAHLSAATAHLSIAVDATTATQAALENKGPERAHEHDPVLGKVAARCQDLHNSRAMSRPAALARLVQNEIMPAESFVHALADRWLQDAHNLTYWQDEWLQERMELRPAKLVRKIVAREQRMRNWGRLRALVAFWAYVFVFSAFFFLVLTFIRLGMAESRVVTSRPRLATPTFQKQTRYMKTFS
ncbi:uncharacterized protein K452DRAFT_51412 [Aplosporella prunicola CBS 121167]|uniref:Uncharacterized protein n=1 Tax=Aplosporella prunicola CBS 121167 TaxID=1176127 RepID=A0A6A6AW76_9PEZI|nr:uncharacterized protein K452DRAFT_51412 [Aplosporella prunicola CBS 121167]KAF2135194.1 hypothetical protein K452DRAFT_51412 [Aplosporella prunicola CBS 121167]